MKNNPPNAFAAFITGAYFSAVLSDEIISAPIIHPDLMPSGDCAAKFDVRAMTDQELDELAADPQKHFSCVDWGMA